MFDIAKRDNIDFEANDLYLSDFAEQMAEILKSGMTVEDGLSILFEDSEEGSEEAKVYEIMLREIRYHGELSTAMSMVGVFPEDMLRMVSLGEKTGHLERILYAQSRKYRRLAYLKKSMKVAILYPVFISLVMIILIAVILMFVMPVFKNAYSTLGVELSGLALFFYNTGNWFGAFGLPVFVVLVMVFLVKILMTIIKLKKRERISTSILYKDRDLISECEFASAMATCVSGGINIEESLSMAMDATVSKKFERKIMKCLNASESGMAFFESLDKAGIFNKRIIRRIQIAEKTAELDTVLQTIADDLQNEIDYLIERKMARVEPILIGVLSGISALILFSVMLPLMSIMSTL